MKVQVNGELVELAVEVRLDTLVDHSERVAVEVNGQIVPRSQWASTALQPGDRIEIVRAIGGG